MLGQASSAFKLPWCSEGCEALARLFSVSQMGVLQDHPRSQGFVTTRLFCLRPETPDTSPCPVPFVLPALFLGPCGASTAAILEFRNKGSGIKDAVPLGTDKGPCLMSLSPPQAAEGWAGGGGRLVSA